MQYMPNMSSLVSLGIFYIEYLDLVALLKYQVNTSNTFPTHAIYDQYVFFMSLYLHLLVLV